jgi:phospholipid transport system transporter-binding protein
VTEIRQQADRVFAIAGDLGFESVAGVLAGDDDLWRQSGECSVDLATVKRIDSAGVALLLEWQREARRRGVSLRFRNVPRQLLSIAEVCGVRGLLPLE